MCVDGLEESQDDPEIDGDYVEVLREVAVQERTGECSCAQDEHLGGVSVLCSETEWCRVLVVNLVDVLV